MFKFLFFVVAIAGAAGAYLYYFHKTPADVRDELMSAAADTYQRGKTAVGA